MNITRDVINDLLPAYFSGEASADTCRLVEEYFRQDAAFEQEARRALEIVHSPGGAAPPLSDAQLSDAQIERAALKRAKRMLRIQAVLLAVASTLSLNAISLGFSFEIEGGHTRVHWLTLPGQPGVVLTLVALSAASWFFYFRIRRRVRARVLGG